MPTNAETFKAALQRIEVDKDPKALVDLFTDASTVDVPSRETKLTGKQSIHHFWSEYLAAFDDIRSTFTTEHTIGDTSVLQWVSEGHLATGRPIKYRGVSIVTFKGYKVATFTTYFDSAAFVTPAAESPAEESPAATSAGTPASVAGPGHASNSEGGD